MRVGRGEKGDLGRVSSEDKKRVHSRQTRLQCEQFFKNFNHLTREGAK